MARVRFTAHLPALFPQLEHADLRLPASTLAELVHELERLAPGIAFYICDERGRLRKHVNIFVEGELLMDRTRLQDRLSPDSDVFVAQALSGG
jgi:hypothetical protein